jgi:hypothetical protein
MTVFIGAWAVLLIGFIAGRVSASNHDEWKQ